MATVPTHSGGAGPRRSGGPPSPSARSNSTRSGGGGDLGGGSRATAITIGLVLVSRVLGVLRNVVIGHLFGQTAETSQYWAAFGVPDLIALVIAGGGLSSVFIPVFTKYWNERREEDAWRIFGTVMCITSLVIAALVVGMEIGVVPLTARLNDKFSHEDVLATARLSRILLPAQWFLIAGSFIMGTLYARKRFLVPALGPVIYNLGTILGGLSQMREPHPDMAAMAWGTLFGAVCGSFLLPLYELIRTGARWRLGFNVRHPGVVQIGKLLVPVLLGLSLGQLTMWITQRLLPADGRLTALKTANDLTQAPIGIFAQAFAIVLLPTISAHAATKDWPAFRKAINLGLRRVLFLTVPASLLMAALALPLVRTLYLGGKFNDENAHVVATALIYYSLGTFAWSGIAILARGFYARQDTWTPILITTPMVFIFWGLGRLAMKLAPTGTLSVILLALSASVVGTVTMLLFLFLLQKKAGGLNLAFIISSTIRIFVASGIAGGVAWLISRRFDELFVPDRMASLVTLLVAGGAGIVVYGGIALALKFPELLTIREMFQRRGGKAPS